MDYREVKKKKEDLIREFVGIYLVNEYSLYYDISSGYGRK